MKKNDKPKTLFADDGSWGKLDRWLDTWSVYKSHTVVVVILCIIIALYAGGVL